MAVNGGELMEPGRERAVERDMLSFLREQIRSGVDRDVLTDIGYPDIGEDAEFSIHAVDDDPADMEPAEPVEPAPEPAPEPAKKPSAKYRKPPKARTARDRAARDSRPDLKPFPYGTMED